MVIYLLHIHIPIPLSKVSTYYMLNQEGASNPRTKFSTCVHSRFPRHTLHYYHHHTAASARRTRPHRGDRKTDLHRHILQTRLRTRQAEERVRRSCRCRTRTALGDRSRLRRPRSTSRRRSWTALDGRRMTAPHDRTRFPDARRSLRRRSCMSRRRSLTVLGGRTQILLDGRIRIVPGDRIQTVPGDHIQTAHDGRTRPSPALGCRGACALRNDACIHHHQSARPHYRACTSSSPPFRGACAPSSRASRSRLRRSSFHLQSPCRTSCSSCIGG